MPKITFQLLPQLPPSGLKLGLCLALLSTANNFSQQIAWAKPARNTAAQADLIITNAKIYNSAQPQWQSALAIRNGQIAQVGSAEEALKLAGPTTKIFDAKAKLIMPGFHDSHVHLAEGGAELLQCRLNSAKSRDDVLTLLKNGTAKTPLSNGY